jgi:hypothetical protein
MHEFWAAPSASHLLQKLISAPDLPTLEAKIINIESRPG